MPLCRARPSRRGYPGYLFSDLAGIYERCGRIRGRGGSITELPVLTMPSGDITHPVPDLTGYITEGQIVLSRELHQKGIYPPVDVLPSLSRLMQHGIGKGQTRDDHRDLANHLYRTYAKGCDLRRLEAVVGRDGMLDEDCRLLDFADRFETEFVHQGNRSRTIDNTLDTARQLLDEFREETGLDLLPRQLLRTFDTGFNLYYCEIHSGSGSIEPRSFFEVQRAYWLPLEDFGRVDWRFPGQGQELEQMLRRAMAQESQGRPGNK